MENCRIKENNSTTGLFKPIHIGEPKFSSAKFYSTFPDFSPNIVTIIWNVNSTMKPSDKKFVLSDLLRNISIINSYAKLRKNWNENGASPFTQKLINKTIEVLRNLNYQPQVFPTARNSILLEYGKPTGGFLGIEVFENRIETFIAPQKITKILDHRNVIEISEIVNEFNSES